MATRLRLSVQTGDPYLKAAQTHFRKLFLYRKNVRGAITGEEMAFHRSTPTDRKQRRRRQGKKTETNNDF